MASSVRADLLVARLAAEQWGVLSLAEARACGLTPRAVGVRVGRGQLHVLHRGVYAVGHAAPPVEGRWLAAVRACGAGAELSHVSAAALWGFSAWDDRHPEVTVAGDGGRSRSGIRVHRSSLLAGAELTRHRGIAVTSPARTLLDLAATLPEKPLRRAVRQAQSLQRVNVRQRAERVACVGRRPGARRLAEIIAGGPAPARSELEAAVLDLIVNGGFERPGVNARLAVEGRRRFPDFRWPRQRLIVEADSVTWHDSRIARRDDEERQAALEAHGERVLRVPWRQAVTHPGETLQRIGAAGAPRAPQPRASEPQPLAAAAAPRSAPASRARASACWAAGDST